MPETITDDGEIIEHENLPTTVTDTALAAAYARAEYDVQVSTAKNFPRSIQRATDSILSLATYDEETAAEAMYALPRGKKPIKGPSVRLAEIVAQQWGNNRVDARIVTIDRINKQITAEGFFHDLETNSAIKASAIRRISDKHGRLYSDDMIAVTGAAACSIARRNAILAGVPKAIWQKAYKACEKVVAGDIKTLAVRRENAIKAFGVWGVKPEQIFSVLDIKGIEDITLEHIPVLLGMHSAIKSGEHTVEDYFDPRVGKPFEVVANPLKDEAKPPESISQELADKVNEVTGQPKVDLDPKPDHLLVAYESGAAARRQGIKRSTPPGELREPARADELAEWQKGWDAANKANDAPKLV